MVIIQCHNMVSMWIDDNTNTLKQFQFCMKTARNVFWEWWQQCRAEYEKFRHTVKLVTIQIPWYGDLYGYQLTYYGICLTTSSNQVYIYYLKTSCLCLQGWYSWRGCQNLSILSVSKKYEWKTNKYALFSWFWVPFCYQAVKQNSR